MSERLPTTKDIRNWATWVPDTTVGMKVSQQAEVEFDAWLAAHDREVAARVLREAADDWQRGQWASAPRRADRVQERLANAQHVGDWLRARADAHNPQSLSTPEPPQEVVR